MRLFTHRSLLLASVMLFAAALEAQQVVSRPRPGRPGSWRRLGVTVAGFAADHDAIIVAGPGDAFRTLKFRVFDAPLRMERMVVTYENGVPENIIVRYNIPQGGESRMIDLRGGQRRLLGGAHGDR
jgi:hypothetical protein